MLLHVWALRAQLVLEHKYSSVVHWDMCCAAPCSIHSIHIVLRLTFSFCASSSSSVAPVCRTLGAIWSAALQFQFDSSQLQIADETRTRLGGALQMAVFVLKMSWLLFLLLLLLSPVFVSLPYPLGTRGSCSKGLATGHKLTYSAAFVAVAGAAPKPLHISCAEIEKLLELTSIETCCSGPVRATERTLWLKFRALLEGPCPACPREQSDKHLNTKPFDEWTPVGSRCSHYN